MKQVIVRDDDERSWFYDYLAEVHDQVTGYSLLIEKVTPPTEVMDNACWYRVTVHPPEGGAQIDKAETKAFRTDGTGVRFKESLQDAPVRARTPW